MARPVCISTRLAPRHSGRALDVFTIMNAEKRGDGPGPWILFPEVIGTSVVALLLPLPLIHLIASGQVVAGGVGFVTWLAAVFFAVRFIRRRQYAFILLPLLALIGLFLVVLKVWH